MNDNKSEVTSKLNTRLLINSLLIEPVKQAFYLSDYFINLFQDTELLKILENWSDEKVRLSFGKKISALLDRNLTDIQNYIIENINDRRAIINEVFEMYKNNFYSGVIVLSLSQVDGLMKEITQGEVGFYNSTPEKSKKSPPNRLKYLEKEIFLNYFSEYHLLDIDNRNEFMLFQKDIEDMKALNRHSILHGESSQFGSKTNAVKSLLLLVFISDLYDVNVGNTEYAT